MRPPISLFLPLLLLLALTVWSAPASVAQSQGACQLGTAAQDLDINNVRARIYNKGNLFFDGGDPNYEVPAGSGINSIFAGGIWIGGLVNGDIRIAAATYAQFGQNYEFYPGPLNEDGSLPNRNDCTPYDRIFKVGSTDIATYLATGNTTPDLLEWPTGLGAPTCVDANNDGRCQPTEERVEATSREQLIDLDAGQIPDIKGDQGLWWVMNDVGGPHLSTLSEPIGMEVRVLVFAFARADALGDATFYDYTFIYRGQQPLEETFLTIFSDPDLGNFNDDYIGSDPENGIGFVYNADNDDEGGDGYGTPPPALGYDFFLGPITDVDGDGVLDTLQMTKFGYFNNDNNARNGNPNNDTDYFRYGRGLWKDGTPWTEGGTALDATAPPVDFVYPNSGSNESPTPGYWSEVCPTPSCATANQPADRRFLMSTGPFTMEPGESQRVVYGIVWARGSNNFTSLQAMKTADVLAQRAFDLDFSLAPPPPAPAVEATELNRQVVIRWSYPESGDPRVTNYLGGFDQVDPLIGGLAGIEDSTYTMQGFNIYRFPNSNFFESDRELVAVYDKVDGLQTIIDEAFDPATGTFNSFVAARGTDSGLQFYHTIEEPLTNYQDYYYGVSAYAYNDESTPKVIESPVARVVVRPADIAAGSGGSELRAMHGQSIQTERIGGGGAGTVSVSVVDPTAVTGDQYRVEFVSVATGAPRPEAAPLDSLTYRIINTTTGETLFNGVELFERGGPIVEPINQMVTFEGLAFFVTAPPEVPEADEDAEPGFAGAGAGVVEVSVATGSDPCAGVPQDPTAEGYDPGCRFYGGNTVWLSANRTGDYAVTTPNNALAGLTNAAGAAAPDDYEMRFTQTCATPGNCFGIYASAAPGGNDLIASVPFELWNVGTASNDFADDDVRMIPFLRAPTGMEPVSNWEDELSAMQTVIVGSDTLELPVSHRVLWMMPDRPDGYQRFEEAARSFGGVGGTYEPENDGDDEVQIFVNPATGAQSECLSQNYYADMCYRNANNRFAVPIGGVAGMVIADVSGNGTPDPGTVIRFLTVPKAAVSAQDVLTFDTSNFRFVTGSDSVAVNALDRIGVVPNPYRGFSTYETGSLDRRVRFINLPDEATIRIFTLSGTLIRTLQANNTRSFDWDLETSNGLPVASGMYLVHVDTPAGERVLKLAIVNRESRFDVF